jgi:tetratricopeptide (TPR) repeat protein
VVFFYVMKGEFERALQDYNQAIQLNPHFGWAYTKRGVLKKGQGKIKEAEVDLLNAIEFAPTISESYRSLCEILYEDPTRKAEAIYYIETAILYNPKDVDLYLFSANIQHDLGEYSEAVNDYQKVLELKPEHPEREKILQAIEWLKSKK